MSKISELSDGGALQSTDYLIAVRSGGNVKVQLSELPSGIGAGGNIVFGDNEKAIFGAGSDLQIYHDGSNSYIDDAGTGALQIRSNGLYLQKYTNENMIRALADGAVSLYYDNAIKLDTTSTGIDVTGTVTADGLTVANNTGSTITLSSTDVAITGGEILGKLDFYSADGSGIGAANRASIEVIAADAAGAGDVYIKTSTGGASVSSRVKIANNGDISFYEDTGTTAKFFWDASAESLGIGTSSPSSELHVSSSGSTVLTVERTTAGSEGKLLLSSATNENIIYSRDGSTGAKPLRFIVGASEAMRIDSSGNVGIGTDSPSGKLHLSGDGDSASKLTVQRTGATTGTVTLGYNYVGSFSNNEFKFFSNSSEAMRLDASGNLLVGTTTSPSDTGTIVADGVYLGGTGSANLLDDYEEGTWTGTLKGGTTEPATLKTAQGYYTKVGNTVTVHISFLNTDTTGYSGHVSVSGLPFGKNANNTRFTFKPALYNINIPGLDSFGFLESSGSTTVSFYSSRNNNAWSTVTHSAGASRYIEFSFTYLTT